MPSIRCVHCNFLNFDTEPACKRCRQPLGNHAAEPAFASAGAGYGQAPPVRQSRPQVSQRPVARQASSTYFEPPPPNFYPDLASEHPQPFINNAGPGSNLPDLCLKCGGKENLHIQKFRKDYTPPAVYLALLMSPLVMAILVSILRKRHKVSGPFCHQCWSKYKYHSVLSGLFAVFFLFVFFVGMVVAVAAGNAIVAIIGIGGPLAMGVLGSWYFKNISPKFVKMSRKQIFIDVPGYGEVDLTNTPY